jgi:hypothetical protein
MNDKFSEGKERDMSNMNTSGVFSLDKFTKKIADKCSKILMAKMATLRVS